MLVNRPLGYTRFGYAGLGDLTSLIQAIPGEADAENYLRQQAQAGAEQAIPEIKAQILPPLIGALVLSAGAFFLSVAAFRATRKKASAT